MKEISYWDQNERGLHTRDNNGKFLFPHRDFKDLRPGAITDIKVVADKDKYAFISAEHVKVYNPTADQIITHLSKNSYKRYTVVEAAIDPYTNSYVCVTESNAHYGYVNEVVKCGVIRYDDGTEVVDSIHGLYGSARSTSQLFDDQLMNRSFEHDKWTSENVYRIAECMTSNTVEIYMDDDFVVIGEVDYIYRGTADMYYACIFNNNSIIKFPVSKSFIWSMSNHDNIIRDIIGVLQEMPVGIESAMIYAVNGFYHPRNLDAYLGKSTDDAAIRLLVKMDVITIFEHRKNKDIVFACINSDKLGYFESLASDEKDNAWDFIDHINSGTDAIMKKLVKRQGDPRELTQYLWRKKLFARINDNISRQ